MARSSVMAENLPDWSMRTPSVSFLVTLISIQLPRSGMMRQRVQLAFAGLGLDDEIDAGRAVQLADDDALGAVDDELAAADHDRHVAEVDFLLDGLLLVEAQPDAEGPAVGQAELPALVGAVARLAQLVLDVLQRQRLVVALDGEDFAQHAFQAGRACAFRAACRAAGSGRRSGSGVGQRRHLDGIAEAAEIADLLGDNGALGRDGHGRCSSQSERATQGTRRRRRYGTAPTAASRVCGPAASGQWTGVRDASNGRRAVPPMARHAGHGRRRGAGQRPGRPRSEEAG